MSEREWLEIASEWLRYAEDDLATARILLNELHVVPRHIGYFAQQAVEKAIKGVIFSTGSDAPRTHDIETLRALLMPGWFDDEELPELSDLTMWATTARYPMDSEALPSTDAERAVEVAAIVVTRVRSRLGLDG